MEHKRRGALAPSAPSTYPTDMKKINCNGLEPVTIVSVRASSVVRGAVLMLYRGPLDASQSKTPNTMFCVLGEIQRGKFSASQS